MLRKVIRGLTVAAAAAILITGLVAWSASFASAQQSDQNDSDVLSAPEVTITAPDKKAPPADFAGCWDGSSIGSLIDQNSGKGYGWVLITQKKGKIKSTFEFQWGNDYAYSTHAHTGKATATGFRYNQNGKCSMKIIGSLGGSNDIVGTYENVCKKGNFDFVGTFDLPLDNSGCQFVQP